MRLEVWRAGNLTGFLTVGDDGEAVWERPDLAEIIPPRDRLSGEVMAVTGLLLNSGWTKESEE